MQVVYERCCGLDIHKKSVVACVLITPETGAVQRYLRTFSPMTAGLLAQARLVGKPADPGRGDGIDWGLLETGV